MQPNFEWKVEKLVYGGEGLGRVDGRVVLAPFVLPGETVRTRVESERAQMVRARVEDVIEAAPQRVAPPCPYFMRCGGCHYQHAPYEMQLEAKREILRETLRRVGKMEWNGEIAVVAAEPWGYRNRTQFHLEGGKIGFREAGSRALCPVDQCAISSPRVNQTLETLRGMLRDSRWPRFVKSIELFTNEDRVQVNVLESDRPVARRFFEWCAELIPGAADGALEYRLGDVTYRVGNKSFFQVNRFLAQPLVDTALDAAAGDTALDLYAGVGLFTLAMARRFARVTAVESGSGAVRDLRHNAGLAGLSVEGVQSSVDQYVEQLQAAPDFVLADPPRSGLGSRAVAALARLHPRALTIVSCDPATLARDLAALCAAGYTLGGLTVVDLFPQTFHIETIARLEWRA